MLSLDILISYHNLCFAVFYRNMRLPGGVSEVAASHRPPGVGSDDIGAPVVSKRQYFPETWLWDFTLRYMTISISICLHLFHLIIFSFYCCCSDHFSSVKYHHQIFCRIYSFSNWTDCWLVWWWVETSILVFGRWFAFFAVNGWWYDVSTEQEDMNASKMNLHSYP